MHALVVLGFVFPSIPSQEIGLGMSLKWPILCRVKPLHCMLMTNVYWDNGISPIWFIGTLVKLQSEVSLKRKMTWR